MTRTENYQLPQWAANDSVRRDDFNGAMANIDAGITAARQAAKTAQGAADAAQGTANTARTEAAALPYATGSYTGTGSNVTITLGFRPSFVIICGHVGCSATNTESKLVYAFSATGGNAVSTRIQLTSTGFVAGAPVTGNLYPDFTMAERKYDYIAFR